MLLTLKIWYDTDIAIGSPNIMWKFHEEKKMVFFQFHFFKRGILHVISMEISIVEGDIVSII